MGYFLSENADAAGKDTSASDKAVVNKPHFLFGIQIE